MTRNITFDGEDVAACPACDSAGCVYERTADNAQGDERYRCGKCGARFDEYVRRESQHDPQAASVAPGPQSDAAQSLMDADPSVVGGGDD